VSPLFISGLENFGERAMLIRTGFVRSVAWGLVVTGLMIGSIGEILVIENELVSGEVPGAPSDAAQGNLSLWPVVGIGSAIAAFGLLLLVLGPLYARLIRRRILAGLEDYPRRVEEQ